MKRPVFALAALALATRLALAAEPAQVAIYVFDEDQPLAEADVIIDGVPRGRTSADGALLFDLAAGQHRLQLRRGTDDLLAMELEVQPDENTQLIATLREGGEPSVLRESSTGMAISALAAQRAPAMSGPPGVLHGRVLNSEDGKPVVGARVFVSGTPLDIVTDANGEYSAPVAPGEYSISVLAADFSTLTLDGVKIASEQATAREVELTPAGIELPEFVVLEPFVEGSLAAFVEEKRSSSAVADILGAEQISRAGDSDAAGALKRVTGLTLVDGRFVYVRGLGERYSSVLLNGAQIPSPDPTRRVVPLDLFPTDVLSGIVVQKTYSAEMPGEFGGGTIQMRTRGVPEDFLLRVQGTLGYADGTTGERGLRSRGGGRDWLGRDDGFRAPPSGLFQRPLPARGSAELAELGRSLAGKGFGLDRKQIGPNTGAAFSVGDNYSLAEGEFQLGFIGSGRYSQSWDLREEERAEFSVQDDGQLIPQQRFQREQAERAIDAGLFLSLGAAVGEHHRVNANLMQFRQSFQEEKIDEGLRSSGNNEQGYSSEWIENQLLTRQLVGEHVLPALGELKLDWQYTSSRAERESPFSRSYTFTELDPGVYIYTNSFPVSIRYESLLDEVDEAQFALSFPWQWSETRGLGLSAGLSQLDRERASDIYRFSFRNLRQPPRVPTPIDDILNPGQVDAGIIELVATGRATDFYTAQQTLDARFLSADLRWDAWRATLGLREEDNDQAVLTQDPFQANAQPIVGRIAQTDRLPSAALTWSYSESAQLRFGYSETVSRPDFRELSRAPFTDPQLDISVIGNPELEQAAITSYDLRWEYYFNPTEVFSVALFRKEFLKPIELVRTPASGDLLELRNAESAENQGVEFDLYRSFEPITRWQWLPDRLRTSLPWQDLYLGLNYAWIDSTIDLGANAGIQTSAQRPLQGQSPYVGNLSLSWLPEGGDVEATLLYNVFGQRISKVGESGVPDEYEQPFHQLDFTLGKTLPWDGWKLKLRLRNLLDPELQFTQGSEASRSFRKGRELAVSIEWKY